MNDLTWEDLADKVHEAEIARDIEMDTMTAAFHEAIRRAFSK